MNVVLVEPFFPHRQREFARALAQAGATVTGIGEYPAGGPDDELKSWLYHHEQVASVTGVAAMTQAVRGVPDKLWADRLEATVEAHIMATALVRDAWDLYSAGHGMDLYRTWAGIITRSGTAAAPSPQFACGIIALRPSQDGVISGYSGVEELQQQLGEWVLDAHRPAPGTPAQRAEAGYLASAYARLRHPDYDVLGSMPGTAGRTLHVCAS